MLCYYIECVIRVYVVFINDISHRFMQQPTNKWNWIFQINNGNSRQIYVKPTIVNVVKFWYNIFIIDHISLYIWMVCCFFLSFIFLELQYSNAPDWRAKLWLCAILVHCILIVKNRISQKKKTSVHITSYQTFGVSMLFHYAQ